MKNIENAKTINAKDEIQQGFSESEMESIEREKLFGELAQLIENCGGPEAFFSSGQYESIGRFEDIVAKISGLAFRAVIKEDFSETIDIGRQLLEVSGITAAKSASTQSPNGAIALAEAINWGAKSISYAFYSLKPAMIVAASQIGGVFFGYGDDGAYYLGSPTIGVASFHDPGDEVGYILGHYLKKDIPEWEYEWSGVSRQESAFELLNDLNSGQGLAKAYANSTSPEEMVEVRDKYMENNFRERLHVLDDLLKHRGIQ